MKKEKTAKEIFSSKFREITKGYKNTEVAKMLGKSLDTINKWRSDTNNHMPDTAGILSICKAFNCDPNYLFLENQENFNSRYDEISSNIGLTSKSIEVLKRINATTGKTSTGMAFGSGIDNHSWKHIAMINYILEDMYDHNYMSKDYKGDEPILSVMYDYLHTENIQHIHSMKDVNKAFGIVRDGDDLDQVMFYDQETHVQYTLPDPVKLFRRTMMDSIQKWLVDQTDKQKNGRH